MVHIDDERGQLQLSEANYSHLNDVIRLSPSCCPPYNTVQHYSPVNVMVTTQVVVVVVVVVAQPVYLHLCTCLKRNVAEVAQMSQIAT